MACVSLTQTNKAVGEEQVRLRRTEVRAILKRHDGSISEVARQLGVTTQSVSMYLRGKGTSERIADATHAKALELLAKEGSTASAA